MHLILTSQPGKWRNQCRLPEGSVSSVWKQEEFSMLKKGRAGKNRSTVWDCAV